MSLRLRLARLLDGLRKPARFARGITATLRRLDGLASAEVLFAIRRDRVMRNPLLAYGAKHYSQHDEDGIIEEIARRVLGPRCGTFLELGVGNGLENNTLNLLAKGWRGVWLGGESLAFASTGPRLHYKQCWIKLDNISQLVHEALRAHDIEQPDLLSVDLDGNDHAFCKQMVASGLKPAIWIVEYNARFSADTRWVMPYDGDHQWDRTDYFGASLAAFHELLAPAGYRLVACNVTGVNAFFVRTDLAAEHFPEVPDDWRLMAMSPTYLLYPSFTHPQSVRTVQSLLE
jgi:hypothetical protein